MICAVLTMDINKSDVSCDTCLRLKVFSSSKVKSIVKKSVMFPLSFQSASKVSKKRIQNFPKIKQNVKIIDNKTDEHQFQGLRTWVRFCLRVKKL
jgi:hypothetical protein